MISTVAIPASSVSARHLPRDCFQAIERRVPALLVQMPALGRRELFLHDRELRAARCGSEGDGYLGLVTARAVLIFPSPGEDEAAWRLDDAIDAADDRELAGGRAHGRAPRPTRADIERMRRDVVAFWAPPFDEKRGL